MSKPVSIVLSYCREVFLVSFLAFEMFAVAANNFFRFLVFDEKPKGSFYSFQIKKKRDKINFRVKNFMC